MIHFKIIFLKHGGYYALHVFRNHDCFVARGSGDVPYDGRLYSPSCRFGSGVVVGENHSG